MKLQPASQRPPESVGPPLSSGFPSPADDYEEPPLDLHHLLVVNPLATYFMRAETSLMVGAGIESGDLLVVDRSKEVKDGDIVIAVIGEIFRVVRSKNTSSGLTLQDDNGEVSAPALLVWGVVTYVIRQVSP